ncbi:plasmid transfer protein TraA [Kitasatospora sp. NPDC093550]|uniref:plasmid transfer protein TraA n=1 Tax=Kitasatospora sp. NPDC093550 TaxID=3364089 RepID=UPI003809A610
MSTPPNNSGNPFPPPRRSGNPAGAGKTPPPPRGGNSRTRVGPSYHFSYTRNTPSGGGMGGARYGGGRGPGGPGPSSGPIGTPSGGGQGGGRGYSPLGDPEFFTNADVREFCERGRATFAQLSFDLAMAFEILQAVLKEVPDADGRPFGSLTRARRVSKHLKKAADDAKDCAAEIARTYAAFQREYDPEISRVAKPRQPRRRFDFGG